MSSLARLRRLEEIECDVCCVCTGLFNEPYIPDWADSEAFCGKIVHSKHLTDVSIAKVCLCSLSELLISSCLPLLHLKTRYRGSL